MIPSPAGFTCLGDASHEAVLLRFCLLLSYLGIEHELVEIDLAKREQKSPDFLRLNPFGHVPVLVDGEVVLSDSNAILVYLAKKYGRTDWLPEDAAGAARVQKWLSVAAGEIARGPASARLVTVFKAPVNAADAIKRAHAILTLIEAQLAAGKYILGDARRLPRSRSTVTCRALRKGVSICPATLT